MKLSDYVSDEWVGFGAKANQRQIPSMCDGQCTVTRKLLWALRKANQFEIVERLGLKAAEATSYAHGGGNMVGSLVGMCKDFAGTNNVPMFDKEGQFGHPADREASAPRYISCKISENFHRFFNKTDFEFMERVNVRGEDLEPYVMAPLVPLVLVNGGFGIGSGFGCNIPQYLPVDVINSVIECLEHDMVLTPMTPNWVGWQGTVRPTTNPNKFIPRGTYKKIDTTTIVIDCLPPSYTEKSYTNQVLIPLYESQVIKDFDHESNELDGWSIKIKFKRGDLANYTHEKLVELLGLENSKIPVNINACVWGTDGLLKEYDYIEQLVQDWVIWRLEVYSDRIAYEVKTLNDELNYECARVWLMEQYIESKSLPSVEALTTGLKKQGLDDDLITKLLNISIRTLTKQGANDSAKRQEQISKRLTELKSMTPKSYMLSEVRELLAFYED